MRCLNNVPLLPHSCPLRRAVQIRLFGDPRDTGSEVPALSISVNVCFDSPTVAMRREASRDVVPDFVDGFTFGEALGIGLRCISTSSWTVTALSPSPELLQAVSGHAFIEPGVLFAHSGTGSHALPPQRDSICYGSDTRLARSHRAISGVQR